MILRRTAFLRASSPPRHANALLTRASRENSRRFGTSVFSFISRRNMAAAAEVSAPVSGLSSPVPSWCRCPPGKGALVLLLLLSLLMTAGCKRGKKTHAHDGFDYFIHWFLPSISIYIPHLTIHAHKPQQVRAYCPQRGRGKYHTRRIYPFEIQQPCQLYIRSLINCRMGAVCLLFMFFLPPSLQLVCAPLPLRPARSR